MYNKKLQKLILIIFAMRQKSNKISFDYVLTNRLKTNYKLRVMNK